MSQALDRSRNRGGVAAVAFNDPRGFVRPFEREEDVAAAAFGELTAGQAALLRIAEPSRPYRSLAACYLSESEFEAKR